MRLELGNNLMAKSVCLALVALVVASFGVGAADRARCPGGKSDDYYFQRGSLNATNPRADDFVRAWYSKHLAAMGEPSLSCGNPGEVYRFTWLRTFHHPVVVRVQAEGDHAVLYATELDGAGGYEPGGVFRTAKRVLSADELAALRRAFVESRFDALPTTLDRKGLDGSEWILEASGEGGYHLVLRWTPGDGPVYSIGRRLLALAGWQFKEVY